MLKVIGAGFGRTGTASLQAGLEVLGFGPCYHMREVFTHLDDIPVWEAATRGENVDFAAFFANWTATVDWPGCTFYRELMAVYPDAKVLLNVRDPDTWYASCLATIFGPWIDPSLIPVAPPWAGMAKQLVWERTFQKRGDDRTFTIDVFNRHNEEVKATVPAEKLLVYDVKQGWEPLCQFLNVPVPRETPFPHLNDTASFLERRQQVREAPLGQ
jgi:hypothetical protein